MIATINLVQPLTTISILVGVVGIGGAVYAFLRFNNYKETVLLQNANIKALQDQAIIHSEKLAEQAKEIEALKTRNHVVESLPLKDIFKSLEQIHKDVLILAKAAKIKEK
jgi:prephenate dehydrogenase